MGWTAAFIPSRRDPEINRVALEKVRQNKEREAGDGFDGSWVAHPDLVPVCAAVFDAVLAERPNQLESPELARATSGTTGTVRKQSGDEGTGLLSAVPIRHRDDVKVTADQLLDVASVPGTITEAGLRGNIDIALRYLEWSGGMAGRQRCGRYPQPDGGRGHRRDLPIAGAAMGAERRNPGHRVAP